MHLVQHISINVWFRRDSFSKTWQSIVLGHWFVLPLSPESHSDCLRPCAQWKNTRNCTWYLTIFCCFRLSALLTSALLVSLAIPGYGNSLIQLASSNEHSRADAHGTGSQTKNNKLAVSVEKNSLLSYLCIGVAFLKWEVGEWMHGMMKWNDIVQKSIE